MNLGTLDLTYALSFLHILLYAVAFAFTIRPVITVFHGVLAVWMIAFGIRPILSAMSGGVSLYYFGSDWRIYNIGLIYQFIFSFFYVFGYLSFPYSKLKLNNIKNLVSLKSILNSFFIGVFAIILVIILSGNKWLPTMRFQTITSVVPFGKYIFPFAVVPLSLLIPMSFLFLKKGKRKICLIFAVNISGFFLLSLLYQRGFALFGFILTFFLYERLSFNNFTCKKTILLLVILLLILFISIYLRPVVVFILSGVYDTQITTPRIGNLVDVMKKFFLMGANFDNIDVWTIVIKFVQENGLQMGRTFIALPLRFFKPQTRLDLNFKTAVDILNEFYWGELYWRTNFGFNVILSQEMYLNFGILSLFLGSIPGFITAVLDKWVWSICRFNVANIYFLAALFTSGGFVTGEFGGILLWMFAYLLLGLLLSIIEKLR